MGLIAKAVRRREYTPDKGNVFEFIVEEVARVRHYEQRNREVGRMEQALKRGPLPGEFKSLRGFHRGHPVHILKRDEPGLQTSGEHPFEISKARKL